MRRGQRGLSTGTKETGRAELGAAGEVGNSQALRPVSVLGSVSTGLPPRICVEGVHVSLMSVHSELGCLGKTLDTGAACLVL